VFLISVFDSATAARCPDPLLPVSEGVQWHPSTSNQARQTTPGEVGSSLASGRDIANTISAELYHKSTVVNQDVNNGHLVVRNGILGSDIVGPLNTSDAKMISSQYVNENKVIVEPMVFQPGSMVRLGTKPSDGIVPTLRAEVKGGDNEPVIAYAFPIQDGRDIDKHQNGLGVADEGAPSYTIDQTGAQAIAYGLQGNMIGRQDHNGPQGAGISHPDDPMFSLTSTDRHGVVQYDGYNQRLYEDDVSLTIRIGRDSSDFIAQPAQTTMAVRRLTPLECERLMGWPDGWTATKADGTPQSDTHRYKQCGNGIASPVAQWIAQQLLQLDKEHNAPPATTTT
jgi:hypothetical protein